jgi:3-oxoacyl-[acyl-carrier-protein] synthase II
MTRRRVAVTGIGAVASCGIGVGAFWKGLLGPQTPGSDRSVPDFDPSLYFDSPKESRRADPFQQYALAAAGEALDQSGALTADPARIGSLVATGIGGLRSLEDQVMVYYTKGARRVSPFLVPMMMGNAGAASISMRYGFQGPCETTVTACAAGTHSIGNAADLIRWGRADAVVTGGSEAANTPVGQAGFRNMTALSTSGISRPFDVDRDGFVQAEAAGILVLEELELARERGATILAEILGSANTADAYHITAPAPGGSGAIRCMEVALEDAGLTAADIVHINAHGTSTPLNDASEAEAVAKVFGTPGPPVTSTKGVTGHALGAAGAIEAVAVVLSMQHRLIPPTDGHVTMDPELPPINLVVGEPVEWEPGPSLSNSFGFGGHNGTLVIGPPPTD